MALNVLIVGSGAREHALAWKAAQSSRLGRLAVMPGNPGTAGLGENVPVPEGDVSVMADCIVQWGADIVIIGSETWLADGLADELVRRGVGVFGPSKRAATLETSKPFAKELMERMGVPTARFRTFFGHGEALEYARSKGVPLVVKAGGLAAGKGVFVCREFGEVEEALRLVMIEHAFGGAGNQVVIEECLTGPELSVHAFCDGKTFSMMPAVRDHKSLLEGGVGPNTGGMGSVAPIPVDCLAAARCESAVRLALRGLRDCGVAFRGCLFPGVMLVHGVPHVLEYNVRFGDPETQVLMRLLKSDLLDVVEACVNGRLSEMTVEWHERHAACVVLASPGYPATFVPGLPIFGAKAAELVPDAVVFHAGTARESDGQLVTSGGRVLSVTAVGDTPAEARDMAYAAVSMVHFDGMRYRYDVGA